MAQYDSRELFPIVDPDGRTIGCAPRSVCHDGKTKPLHPVVHLHVVAPGPDGPCILLQKRAMTKDIQPGKWDTAVGGHVDYGEEIPDALLRETREELGLCDIADKVVPVTRYLFESARERELVNVFALCLDTPVFTGSYAPDEIDCVRFRTFDEVRDVIGAGELTPNFESEFTRIEPQLQEIVRKR